MELQTLATLKTLKIISLVLKGDSGLTGYANLPITAAYPGADGSLHIQGLDFRVTLPGSAYVDRSAQSPDGTVWVTVPGQRDQIMLSW